MENKFKVGDIVVQIRGRGEGRIGVVGHVFKPRDKTKTPAYMVKFSKKLVRLIEIDIELLKMIEGL